MAKSPMPRTALSLQPARNRAASRIRDGDAFQEKRKAKSLEKHTDIKICKHNILSMAQKKG